MKKSIKNYRLCLNFLLLAGILFFASCSRERGYVSVDNQKLKKQSLEIENSTTYASASTTDEPVIMDQPAQILESEKPTAQPAEKTKSGKEKITSKMEGIKLSPVEKMILKKMSKKMNPESQKDKAEAKRGGLDQNLKLAIIFGGIGIILVILGAIVWLFYYLGIIAIVIGLVFLLIWAINNM